MGSTIREKHFHDFHKFHVFSTLRADCVSLRDHSILKRMLLQILFMINEQPSDILTPFLYSITSQSRVIRSQSLKIMKFLKIMAQTF